MDNVLGWSHLLGGWGTFDVEWVVGLLLLPGFSTLWRQDSRSVNTWNMSFFPPSRGPPPHAMPQVEALVL